MCRFVRFLNKHFRPVFFALFLTCCKPDDIQDILLISKVSMLLKSVRLSMQCATIELWMHLGGLLNTQEARVALGKLSPRAGRKKAGQ